MMNPVSTCDGYIFERSAIAGWFSKGYSTNPVTGRVLPKELRTEMGLRRAILEYLVLLQGTRWTHLEEPWSFARGLDAVQDGQSPQGQLDVRNGPSPWRPGESSSEALSRELRAGVKDGPKKSNRERVTTITSSRSLVQAEEQAASDRRRLLHFEAECRKAEQGELEACSRADAACAEVAEAQAVARQACALAERAEAVLDREDRHRASSSRCFTALDYSHGEVGTSATSTSALEVAVVTSELARMQEAIARFGTPASKLEEAGGLGASRRGAPAQGESVEGHPEQRQRWPCLGSQALQEALDLTRQTAQAEWARAERAELGLARAEEVVARTQALAENAEASIQAAEVLASRERVRVRRMEAALQAVEAAVFARVQRSADRPSEAEAQPDLGGHEEQRAEPPLDQVPKTPAESLAAEGQAEHPSERYLGDAVKKRMFYNASKLRKRFLDFSPVVKTPEASRKRDIKLDAWCSDSETMKSLSSSATTSLASSPARLLKFAKGNVTHDFKDVVELILAQREIAERLGQVEDVSELEATLERYRSRRGKQTPVSGRRLAVWDEGRGSDGNGEFTTL